MLSVRILLQNHSSVFQKVGVPTVLVSRCVSSFTSGRVAKLSIRQTSRSLCAGLNLNFLVRLLKKLSVVTLRKLSASSLSSTVVKIIGFNNLVVTTKQTFWPYPVSNTEQLTGV